MDIIIIVNKLNLGIPIKNNIGVQSMDLYMCEKVKINILLGIRNGDLIEISINNPHKLVTSLTNLNNQNFPNNIGKSVNNENQNIQDSPVPNLELEIFLLYSYPYSYDLYINIFFLISLFIHLYLF